MRDPLRILLRARRAQERQAQAAAARAVAAADSAARAHEEQADAHHGRPAPPGRVSPLVLRALQLQGLASYASLVAAAQEEDRARARAVAADAERVDAAVRRRSTERLVERREQSSAAVAAATAQRILDELTVARWGQR